MKTLSRGGKYELLMLDMRNPTAHIHIVLKKLPILLTFETIVLAIAILIILV